jgi:predicted GNAT superfamily acetyltransferase
MGGSAIEGAAVVSIGAGGEPVRHDVARGVRKVTIQIPLDPDAVGAELAPQWREVTREAFLEWIGAGYRVTDSVGGMYLLEALPLP